MMGSFLSRGFIMVLGYAYPAYECYKSVELNKPEIEQLRFWCQYWILVAAMSFFERIGDALIAWLPMYSEVKLAFFIYLWYPKTKGTTFVYDHFFRPFIAKHESDIDRNLLELRTRVGDFAVLYCQKAASYGQTRFFEILHYVASQSKPEPQSGSAHPVQQQLVHQTENLEQHPPQTMPAVSIQAKDKLQELPKKSNGASPGELQTSPDPIPVDAKTVPDHIPIDPKIAIKQSSKAQAMQVDRTSDSAEHDGPNAPAKETVMEEAGQKSRAKLRKRPAIGVPLSRTR